MYSSFLGRKRTAMPGNKHTTAIMGSIAGMFSPARTRAALAAIYHKRSGQAVHLCVLADPRV